MAMTQWEDHNMRSVAPLGLVQYDTMLPGVTTPGYEIPSRWDLFQISGKAAKVKSQGREPLE